MSRTADLAAELDAAGLTLAAPIDHQLMGVAESRWVPPEHLVPAAAAARRAGFFFESMTCTDRLAATPHGAFELLYTFNRYDEPARMAVRVWVPNGTSVPTLTRVYGIAEWNEREAWEFFGIRFAGHPNLTWLLLPEGTEFHPLLKSFTAPPPSQYDDTLNAAPAAGAAVPESGL